MSGFGRALAVLLASASLVQAAGPGLVSATTRSAEHGEHRPSGDHPPGCPWKGVGPCPHAHRGGHGEPGWTACGDDLATAFEAPRTILAPPVSRDRARPAAAATRPPAISPPRATAVPAPPPEPPPPRRATAG